MNRIVHRGVLCAFALVVISTTAQAQFKQIPPAPYTPAAARLKIRALLDSAGPGNQQQTTETLSGLLLWYRDLVDEELIAAWKGDGRANLPALITQLADARVAAEIVDFSWRQQRAATFNLTFAPMLGDLMARYQGSAEPFLRDLPGTGGQMPDLSPTEAAAVCRILLDMPDTANWRKAALQVLPHYRLAAQELLLQDVRGNNQEKSYRAQVWLGDLRWDVPGVTSDPPKPRSRPNPLPATAGGPGQRPHIVGQQSAPLQSGDSGAAPVSAFSSAPFPVYTGPRSGTLKCGGAPVLPDAEYVFPGMPMGNLQVDLEGKPWEARLVPGQGQTQDLVVKNKSSSAQKRCTVHWKLIP